MVCKPNEQESAKIHVDVDFKTRNQAKNHLKHWDFHILFLSQRYSSSEILLRSQEEEFFKMKWKSPLSINIFYNSLLEKTKNLSFRSLFLTDAVGAVFDFSKYILIIKYQNNYKTVFLRRWIICRNHISILHVFLRNPLKNDRIYINYKLKHRWWRKPSFSIVFAKALEN